MFSLNTLLKSSPILKTWGNLDIEIIRLTHDSRKAEKGSLFFALPGSKTDGTLFANEAIARGACAVISECPRPSGQNVSWAQVLNATESMGRVANLFFERPSSSMTLIGVTGTNGKTTVTYFLEAILKACGAHPAVIGTISYRGPGMSPVKAVNTTPSSLELLEMMARLRDSKTTHIAMEVSSHSLALKRVEELDFDAAIFTNLTRDHLDFHKTTDAYFKAKAHLFELLEKSSKKNRVAIINADDPRAKELGSLIHQSRKIFYASDRAKDFSAEDILGSINGSQFEIAHAGKKIPISINLLGKHNVSNALAAASLALAWGLPEEKIAEGLENLKSIPGRLERVPSKRPIHVFVDFAHTDSALETVIKELRALSLGRIITVFGCGGDRDKTKRAPMGQAAAALSDWAIVTNDNPRSEDPLSILKEIERGIELTGRKNYKMIADRGQAIAEAIRLARPNDIVLIAGKGHEDYQIIDGRTTPFSDIEVAKAELERLK